VLVQREMESEPSVREYIAIFDGPRLDGTDQCGRFGARQSAEAATGFKEKSRWLVPRFIPALTQGAHPKTKLAGEGINYHSIRQAGADSFGKRWGA
jgi:hypothetical protein